MSYRGMTLLRFPFLHTTTWNFPCDDQVNVKNQAHLRTEPYTVHKEVRHVPVWIYHISKILISVHLHFLYTCQLIYSTTQKPLHRNLLFLCQPPRTLYSFQDLVQSTIAFQALCSTYRPVIPSRWHKCALFQKDIFSPQLPPFLALYVFKFQLKCHLLSTYNFNYITRLLNSTAFCRWINCTKNVGRSDNRKISAGWEDIITLVKLGFM